MLKINSYRLFFLTLFFNHSNTLCSSFTQGDSDQNLSSLPLPSSVHNASTSTNSSGLGSNMPNNNVNFNSLLSDLFAISLRNAQQVTHAATMGNLTLNRPNFINVNNNNIPFSIPYALNLNATANALFGANNNTTLPSIIPNAAHTSTNVSNGVVPTSLLENRLSTITFSTHTNNNNMPLFIPNELNSSNTTSSVPSHTNHDKQSALTEKKKKKKSTKIYTCPTCNKTLACHYSFKYHLKTHDPNKPKPFQCNICGKNFVRKDTLKTHIKRHNKEKSFKCELCSKCFITKFEKNRHERVHTNEKPFKCNICEKRLSSKDSLKEHLNIHKQIKPYSCEECEKSFRNKSRLNDHRRSHKEKKPFKCTQCTKAYATRGGLGYHLKTHNKQYSCQYCSAAFDKKSEYKNHMRYEERTDKNHKCHLCKKVYVTKATLKRHNKQFHSINS